MEVRDRSPVLHENSFEWHGITLRLPELEWKVASCLVRSAGRVVSREQIAQEIWGNYIADPGRAIDAHVYRLRKRLAGVPGVSIDTVRQRGFRIVLA